MDSMKPWTNAWFLALALSQACSSGVSFSPFLILFLIVLPSSVPAFRSSACPASESSPVSFWRASRVSLSKFASSVPGPMPPPARYDEMTSAGTATRTAAESAEPHVVAAACRSPISASYSLCSLRWAPSRTVAALLIAPSRFCFASASAVPASSAGRLRYERDVSPYVLFADRTAPSYVSMLSW